MSYKLKPHVRSIKISKLYVPFVHLLISLATREFFNYEINVRDSGGPEKILRTLVYLFPQIHCPLAKHIVVECHPSVFATKVKPPHFCIIFFPINLETGM